MGLKILRFLFHGLPLLEMTDLGKFAADLGRTDRIITEVLIREIFDRLLFCLFYFVYLVAQVTNKIAE